MGIFSRFFKNKEVKEIKEDIPPTTPIDNPEKSGDKPIIPDKPEIVINIDDPATTTAPNFDNQQENNKKVSETKNNGTTELSEGKKTSKGSKSGKSKENQETNKNKIDKIKKQAKNEIIKDKGFTDRQWRFVEEYLVDFNRKKAVIRAGYSKSNAGETAYDLLSYPHVIAEIERRKEMISDKAESDAVYVMRRLKAESVDLIHGNAASRVRALELIGKRNGMFMDKIPLQIDALQININTSVIQKPQETQEPQEPAPD